MKKAKKVLKGIGIVALSVVAVLGVWQLSSHIQSKKYNLIKPDTSNLPTPVELKKEDRIKLSQIDMAYGVFGDGEQSVVLIHGNGSNKKRLYELASYLGTEYTVYVPDSRCHGDSSDPGEITYKLMASDIKEFCDALGLVKPYFVGHSDGGINVLTLASMYPDLPGAVIACGANSEPKTFKPYFTAAVKLNDIGKHDKLNELMLTLPDFTKEDFEKISCPTYIVAAEFDIMWLSDTVYIHDSIKDSKISIVEGANHSSYITADGKPAYVLCKDYFDSLKK